MPDTKARPVGVSKAVLAPSSTSRSNVRTRIHNYDAANVHDTETQENTNSTAARSHHGIGFELIKMRDQITSKSKELNNATIEIRTLRSKLAAATKAIESLSRERDLNKERFLKLTGDVAAGQRKLADAAKEATRLQREVATANLAADKAAVKLANVPKGPSFSEQVASLQASLKTSAAENQRLVAHTKALETSLRAKDKEIARLGERETWAKGVEGRSKALENAVLEHKRESEAHTVHIAKLQRVLKQRDAEVSAMQQRLDAGERDLQERSDRLAASRAELAMSQAAVAELQTEVQVLRNEAARVGVVAARVAVNEVRAGTKDCGSVPVAQHVAEITSLTEEVARLRDQVQQEASMRAAAETLCKTLQVAEKQDETVAADDFVVVAEDTVVAEQPALRRSQRTRK